MKKYITIIAMVIVIISIILTIFITNKIFDKNKEKYNRSYYCCHLAINFEGFDWRDPYGHAPCGCPDVTSVIEKTLIVLGIKQR